MAPGPIRPSMPPAAGRSRRFLLRAAGATLLLTGCRSTPPAAPAPTRRSPAAAPAGTGGRPIRLDVAEIRVRRLYQPQQTAPYVDHLFPTPPVEALEQWAAEMLVAAGTSGTAVMTITQGAALLTPLATKTGIVGALTTEPAERYDVEVGAVIDQFDRTGQRVGSASAAASKTSSLDEDANARDRRILWDSLTRDVMTDFTSSMTAAAAAYLKQIP